MKKQTDEKRTNEKLESKKKSRSGLRCSFCDGTVQESNFLVVPPARLTRSSMVHASMCDGCVLEAVALLFSKLEKPKPKKSKSKK